MSATLSGVVGLFTLNLAVQATVAAALGWLLVKTVLRARPAPARYGVLLTALVFVLASPATAWLAGKAGLGYIRLGSESAAGAGAGVPALPPPVFEPKDAAEVVPDRPLPAPALSADTVPDGIDVHPLPAAAVAAAPVVPGANGQEIREPGWGALAAGLLLAIWAAGFLVGLAAMVRGRVVVARLLGSLRPARGTRLAAAVTGAARLLGLRRPPELGVTELVPTPLSLGIVRPRIVFPEAMENSLAEDEMQGIILHETAHIAHRDHAVGLLQRMAGAFFWWNPVVRLLNRALGEAREEICDNYVVRAQGGGERFARCLVAVAERTTAFHRLPVAVGLVHPRSGFERRVRSLLRKDRNTMTRMNLAAVALSALFALGLGAAVLGCGVSEKKTDLSSLISSLDAERVPPEVIRDLVHCAGREGDSALEQYAQRKKPLCVWLPDMRLLVEAEKLKGGFCIQVVTGMAPAEIGYVSAQMCPEGVEITSLEKREGDVFLVGALFVGGNVDAGEARRGSPFSVEMTLEDMRDAGRLRKVLLSGGSGRSAWGPAVGGLRCRVRSVALIPEANAPEVGRAEVKLEIRNTSSTSRKIRILASLSGEPLLGLMIKKGSEWRFADGSLIVRGDEPEFRELAAGATTIVGYSVGLSASEVRSMRGGAGMKGVVVAYGKGPKDPASLLSGVLVLEGPQSTRVNRAVQVKEKRTYAGNEYPAHSLCVSNDGKYVAAGTGNSAGSVGARGSVVVWDAGHGGVHARIRGFGGNVEALGFCDKGRALWGGRYKAVLWDLRRKAARLTLRAPAIDVPMQKSTTAVSADGARFVTFCDKGFQVRDSRTGRVIKTIPLRRVRRRDRYGNTYVDYPVAQIGPGGKLLYHATTAGKITSASIDGSKTRTIVYGPVERRYHCRTRYLRISADGSVLLVKNEGDNDIKVVDIRSGRVVCALGGTQNAFAARFSPGSGMIATADYLEGLRFWNAQNGRQVGRWKPAGGRVSVNALAFFPDGRRVVVALSDRTVRLLAVEYRRAAPKEIAPLPGSGTRSRIGSFLQTGMTVADAEKLLERCGARDISSSVSAKGPEPPDSRRWFELLDGTVVALRLVSRQGRAVVASIDRGPAGAGCCKVTWKPTTVKRFDLGPYAGISRSPANGLHVELVAERHTVESGEAVDVVFRMKNVGRARLVLKRDSVSFGCMALRMGGYGGYEPENASGSWSLLSEDAVLKAGKERRIAVRFSSWRSKARDDAGPLPPGKYAVTAVVALGKMAVAATPVSIEVVKKKTGGPSPNSVRRIPAANVRFHPVKSDNQKHSGLFALGRQDENFKRAAELGKAPDAKLSAPAQLFAIAASNDGYRPVEGLPVTLVGKLPGSGTANRKAISHSGDHFVFQSGTLGKAIEIVAREVRSSGPTPPALREKDCYVVVELPPLSVGVHKATIRFEGYRSYSDGRGTVRDRSMPTLASMTCEFEVLPASTVHVGMKFEAAAAMLKRHGAREVDMDVAPPESPRGGHKEVRSYQLAGKRALVVVAGTRSGGGRFVEELSVCDNPDKPKALRKWKRVRTCDVAGRPADPGDARARAVRARAAGMMKQLEKGKLLKTGWGPTSGWRMKDARGRGYSRSVLQEQAAQFKPLGRDAVPELIEWLDHR